MAEYVVSKTLTNFEMQVDAFKDCIFEANTCFDLLSPEAAPQVLAPQGNEKSEDTSAQKTNGAKVKKSVVAITINHLKILTVQETPDNSSVIQVLDDRIHQAKKSFIPRLDKWIEELIKNNGEQKEVLPLIKMKERLDRICIKYNKLEIQRTSKRKRRIVQKEANESDDSDFEEVNEDDELDKIPEEKRLKLAMALNKPKPGVSDLKNSKRFVTDGEEPCSSGTGPNTALETKSKRKVNPLNKSKGVNLMKTVMKSDAELEAEMDESDFGLQQYAIARFESLHRFWAPKDVEIEEMDINTVRTLNPRYCHVPGKFEPVVWACRAPMKSGKTCPRMDRFKCPLHGKVIPRDKEGKPNGKSGDLFSKSEMLTSKKSNGETWEEVEKEVEKLTGEKLNYSKIKKKREVKPTNLVSLTKTAPVTSRSRIEKKIMNPRALRSVSKKTDKMENARNRSAFDQQFNYSM